MSEVTIGIIIGTLIGFLAQWAGEQFLNRLILPRVLDWWARQSKKMARNRAEYLLKQFELDFELYSNIRLIVLRIEGRQMRMLAFPFALSLLLGFSILANQYTPGERATLVELIAILVAIFGAFTSGFAAVNYQNKRDYRIFADFVLYRKRTIERLEQLFRAAGLDDNQINTLIETVPALSHSEHSPLNV